MTRLITTTHNQQVPTPILPSLLLLCLALLSLTACEVDAEDIEGGLADAKPVVYSVAVSGTPVDVYLASTISYNSNQEGRIGEATISLTYRDSVTYFRSIADTSQASVSFSEVMPAAGDKITLNIETATASLNAETTLPSLVKIVSIDTASVSAYQRLRLVVVMRDDPTTEDYYQLEIRRRTLKGDTWSDSTLSVTYSNYYFQTVSTLLGTQQACVGLFSDADQTTSTYTLIASALWDDIITTDTPDSLCLVARLYHHHPDYYSYLQSSLQAQEYLALPVFGNSTITSNIEGGGLGIVASTTYDERIIRFSRQLIIDKDKLR